MLHALRKLAREIHRRSVWQVLALYLLLWFGAFEVVDLLTAALGLPLWTPAMAFVLLSIGLPIVLATAVVQGGLPGLRMVDLVDPNELEGRSPEEVHVIPEAHPLHGLGFFTWRNAVLGGVMAGALLVTSVVAYLAMWAFGIGPVGSLAAQGILEAGDTVLVARVSADDPSLEARVRALLEEELGRSSFVHVPRWRAGGSPGRLPGEAANTPPDAMAFARLVGAKVVIDTEVGPVDGGYRVVARILLPDGTTLAGFGRTAESGADLPEEVARLAQRLRERFGESLREIHEDASVPAADSRR